MRVLHWYPGFQSGGGAANAVLRLADAQAAVGIEAVVASVEAVGMYGTPTPAAGVELIAWKPTWTLGRGGVVLRGLPRAAVSRLRTVQPDVVHVHGEFNPDNWWVPRLFDAPIVLSPQGSFHPVVLANRTGRAKSLYLRVARRLLYRHVSALHAVTPMEELRLAAVFPDIPVYSAPQGTSIRVEELFGGAAPRPRAAAARFLYVGRLDVFTKGLDILVDAFAAAAPQLSGRPVALTMIGPDWKGGRAVVEERARGAGIADRIELTGPVPGDEIPRLLSLCDCYVQLSRHESFGFGVADALVTGRPVIMTRGMGIASFPEFSSLPHVRVVDPDARAAAAAIVAVVDRLDDLKLEAANASSTLKALLSWERVAKLHRSRYEELVSHRSVPSGPLTRVGDLAGTEVGLTSIGSLTAGGPSWRAGARGEVDP